MSLIPGSSGSELQEPFPSKENHPSQNPSFSVVPPLPSEQFTGRETILKQIADNFDLTTTSVNQGKQRRYVLFGLGGAGKTQIALKFLDEHQDKFVSVLFRL